MKSTTDQLSKLALALSEFLPEEWAEGEEKLHMLLPLAEQSSDRIKVPYLKLELTKQQYSYLKSNS